MNGIFLAAAMLMGMPVLAAADAPTSVEPNGLDALLDAIARVESKGDPAARGELRLEAVGSLQHPGGNPRGKRDNFFNVRN